MNEIVWARPEFVHLAWPAILLVLALAWLELDRNQRLRGWISERMASRLAVGLSPGLRAVRVVAIALTLGFGIAAAMQPQTRERRDVTAEVGSADIVVAVDVSRSMLATDGGIERLDRARAEIRDLLPLLRGNRVALVTFAGRAVEMVPLTTDHGFFQMVLESAGPNSVSRGGTELSDALRMGLDVLSEDPDAGRAMILMTDGEDHGSAPVETAKALAKARIPVIAIGFGSEEGSLIEIENPETGRVEPITYQGEPVRSALDGETLRQIALETDGVYVPARTGALDLESIVDTHISPLLARRTREVKHRRRAELYPWFVALSIVFLCVSSMVGVIGLSPVSRRSVSAEAGRSA